MDENSCTGGEFRQPSLPLLTVWEPAGDLAIWEGNATNTFAAAAASSQASAGPDYLSIR